MARNSKKRRKYEDKRKWKDVNARLIRRGEFYVNPAFLDNWINEVRAMNAGKGGQPYMYPTSVITFLAVLHVKNFDFRALEGILCALSRRLGNFPVICFSQIRRRIRQLPLEFTAKNDNLIAGIDGTGIKVSNRGEWMRQQWHVHRGWIKVVILGDRKGNIIDLRIGNESLDEWASARGLLRNNHKHVKKILMDGLHDCKDTFNLIDDFGMDTGIKIRKNASVKGLSRRSKEVKLYKKLGHQQWCKTTEYGLRWPSTEGIFSAVKTLFGEHVRSHKTRNMYHEARLKFWVYQHLKDLP